MAKGKSETRRLTAGSFVRFHPDDFSDIERAAAKRGMTVPEHLRSLALLDAGLDKTGAQRGLRAS